jgi:hypothetical protein
MLTHSFNLSWTDFAAVIVLVYVHAKFTGIFICARDIDITMLDEQGIRALLPTPNSQRTSTPAVSETPMPTDTPTTPTTPTPTLSGAGQVGPDRRVFNDPREQITYQYMEEPPEALRNLMATEAPTTAAPKPDVIYDVSESNDNKEEKGSSWTTWVIVIAILVCIILTIMVFLVRRGQSQAASQSIDDIPYSF